MAIQPTTRIAGSTRILRFQGSLVNGAAAPQVVNGVVPAGAVANTPAEVKFALADMTDIADRTTKLPEQVYDDGQPAAGVTRPNNTVTGGPSAGGGNVPAGKTWMQNVRVRAQEASASTAAPLIARIDVLTPKAYVDTTTTGLNQNTGVGVVGVNFAFTAAGIAALAAGGVPIILEVEIPYTPSR